MHISLDGWDVANAEDVDWSPWGEGSDARAKILASGDGFFLALVEARAGYQGSPHEHDHTEFLYLLEGELANQGQTMRSGDGYVANAGSTHSEFTARTDCTYLSIFKL